MKNKLILTLILFISFIGMAHSENKINITIDGRTLSATLAANDATKALMDKLAEGPVKITMNNYGGFEKVGALPWALPTSDTRFTTKPKTRLWQSTIRLRTTQKRATAGPAKSLK